MVKLLSQMFEMWKISYNQQNVTSADCLLWFTGSGTAIGAYYMH